MWRLNIHGRRRDKGAVAVIVAVLFGSLVVMGTLALSVDIGGIMSERRQLQNGADASAMALAQLCARKDPACSEASAAGAVSDLASSNANDNQSTISDVCARNVNPDDTAITTACAAGDAKVLGKCNPLGSGFPASLPFVEVTTETLSDAGSTVFTPFARALAGSSGTQVHSCARATWGAPGSNDGSVPLVMGRCNWDRATTSQTPAFAPSPPYTPAPDGATKPAIPANTAAYAVPIFGSLNGSEKDTTLVEKFGCEGDLSTPPSGAYTPGGFGWVDTSAGVCEATISATGTVSASTGGLPTTCKSGTLKNYVGTEVMIPIISAVTGTGTGATYTVDGVSSFFFAGYYNVSAADVGEKEYNAYAGGPCADYKSECVWGWFTSPLLPVGSSSGSGGTPRGPVQVYPAG